jgi:hypothetical protein
MHNVDHTLEFGPFIAKIGPPRVLLGLFALLFAVFGIASSILRRGSFEWWWNIEELFALTFAVLNIGQEFGKGFFRNRFTIVEMDEEGLFDRRIMKRKVLWDDIEWIDPHPAGLPDRLRLVGKVELTGFGKLRNLLIRLVRRLPSGEVLITFGGLNKAGAQAAAWLADNKPGFVSDVWKPKPRPSAPEAARAHEAPLITASAFLREWMGSFVIGLLLVALLAGLLPAMLADNPYLRGLSDSWKLSTSLLIMLAATLVYSGVTGLLYWYHRRYDDQLIVVSYAGISDVRISDQFIGWQDVESISFEYRNMGRLINEALPVTIQLREGLSLKPPKPILFRLMDSVRRIATPELFALSHAGTTTSVSEIIETIQRHELPVAIREIARG